MFESNAKHIKAWVEPSPFDKYPNLDSEEMRFAYETTYDKVSLNLCLEQLNYSVTPPVLKRLDLWLHDLRQFSEDALFPYDHVVLSILRALMRNKLFLQQNQEECRLSRAFLEVAFKYIEGFSYNELTYDYYYDLRNFRRGNFFDYFMNVALFYGFYPGLAVNGLIPSFRQMEILSSEECVYDLFNELFVKYPVPETLLLNFNRLTSNEIEVLAQLLAGKSIRDCAALLEIPVHKKDVHHFMHTLAERELIFENKVLLRYIIYVKLVRFSKNRVLFFQMMDYCKTFRDFPMKFYEDLAFWKHFLSIIEADVQLEEDEVNFDLSWIMDYVEYMRYQETDQTFSLAGRTMASLIRQVGDWHEAQKFAALQQYVEADWSLFYKEDTETYIIENESYKIQELNSGKLLQMEGRELKHCVFTYVKACMRHDAIVLGLRKKVDGHFVPWVTLETDGGMILQAFGHANRSITEDERQVISQWAKKNDVNWDFNWY